MSTATVTAKGQITIPAEVRRRLGLETGDRVEFVETDIAEIVRRMLTSRQLLLQDADVVWKALRQFAAGRADFADCLIHQSADSAGCSKVVTFDRRSGMTLLR